MSLLSECEARNIDVHLKFAIKALCGFITESGFFFAEAQYVDNLGLVVQPLFFLGLAFVLVRELA